MAGVQMEITVDGDEVRRAVSRLLRRSLSLKEPFEDIGASLETSTQQRFEDEEDPEGNPWPDLSEPYQDSFYKGKPRGPDHILRRSAILYQSLTYLANDTRLAVGPGAGKDYAAIHQFGGTADMPAGPAAIPARAYLGISADDRREIGEILADHLQEP